MKKYFLIAILAIVLIMTGCGKENKENLKNKFINDVDGLKSYYLEGTLNINNNDDNYEYDVFVSYEKQDLYKVTLINKANNYEQTILRNAEGVYVVNPSLNRSFKFQSEWPYNNSQSYLLQSLANDLANDEDYEFSQENNNYVFKTKVNYPNKDNLFNQKIIFDKNMNLIKVEVLDDKEIPHIIFTVTSLDKKAMFDNNYFDLTTITKDFEQKEELKPNNDQNETGTSPSTETQSIIDEALFPLYLPNDTSLTNREVINTMSGQRVIMTFGGNSSFILVQENVVKEEQLTVTPSYGEPYLLIDTIGALTDTSYTWISNGIEYYIVSDVLSQKELLEVAKSMNIVATMAEK